MRVIKNGEGTILQRFDYYPFGSESRVWTAGTNTPQSALWYRFGGMEIAGQKVSVSTGAPAAGYNSNLEGTPKNAFRHVLWQTLITTEYGEETAIRVGNAHEDYSIIDYNQRSFKKIEDADTSVDLHNNAIGRQIALDNPGSSNVSLALKVLYHFHTQGLWVVERGKDEFVIYQQKLSDDEYQKAMEELIQLHQDGLKH